MRALSLLLAVAACGDPKTATTPGAPASPGAPTAPGPAPQAGPAQPPGTPGIDADVNTFAGAQLYGALCAPCHGKDLKGYAADNAPSLITRSFLESATDDFLARSILTGRPGTSMAAYGKQLGGPLDEAAVKRLVEFIRGKGGVAPRELPAATRGDAAAGAPVYAQYCGNCHGDKQNRMTAIHLANPMWQAQATDAFIRHAIVEGRAGTPMMAYEHVLSAKQIDDVLAHVRSFTGAGAPQVTTLPPPTGKEPLVLNPKGKDPQWKLREDKYVSVDQVHAAYKAGAKMIIIDARPPSDWMRARIEGAVSIPYHDMQRLPEIPKDTWAVAYCACPHHLSGIVVDELRKRGHTRSAVLDEGVNDWHRKGYPMTVAPGVTPPTNEHAGHDHSGHDHSGHGHGGHGHGVIQ